MSKPNFGKRKLVLGVGLNDFTKPIFVNGKHIREYQMWTNMLKRCYCEKYKTKRPTYIGCYVEDYLLSFTNFYNFISSLKGYNDTDFQLDKDILSKDEKCYSRKTICFIHKDINIFLVKRDASRGKYLIGVTRDKKDGKFLGHISIDGEFVSLGRFFNEIDAHLAYKETKEQQAKVLAERWKDKIDERVYNALINYKVNKE